MFSLKIGKVYALCQLTVASNSEISIARLVTGFYYRLTNFNQLKRQELWFYTSHRWLAYKDSTVRASQDYHWYSWPCGSHYLFGDRLLWLAGLNCKWLWPYFHSKVLVMALLLLRHQEKTLNGLSPLDGWPNKEVKQHYRSLSLYLCQLWAECLG